MVIWIIIIDEFDSSLILTSKGRTLPCYLEPDLNTLILHSFSIIHSLPCLEERVKPRNGR